MQPSHINASHVILKWNSQQLLQMKGLAVDFNLMINEWMTPALVTNQLSHNLFCFSWKFQKPTDCQNMANESKRVVVRNWRRLWQTSEAGMVHQLLVIEEIRRNLWLVCKTDLYKFSPTMHVNFGSWEFRVDFERHLFQQRLWKFIVHSYKVLENGFLEESWIF